MNEEEQVNQLVEEYKKGLGLSPQEMAFLMSMAYDPEMHDGEPPKKEKKPKGRQATQKDVDNILRK